MKILTSPLGAEWLLDEEGGVKWLITPEGQKRMFEIVGWLNTQGSIGIANSTKLLDSIEKAKEEKIKKGLMSEIGQAELTQGLANLKMMTK
jgi:acetyl-CoA carboxylase beta subunit